MAQKVRYFSSLATSSRHGIGGVLCRDACFLAVSVSCCFQQEGPQETWEPNPSFAPGYSLLVSETRGLVPLKTPVWYRWRQKPRTRLAQNAPLVYEGEPNSPFEPLLPAALSQKGGLVLGLHRMLGDAL